MAAGACFLVADASQKDDADGSHEDEFQRIPQEEEKQQVEPFAPPVTDEGGAGDGGEEINGSSVSCLLAGLGLAGRMGVRGAR